MDKETSKLVNVMFKDVFTSEGKMYQCQWLGVHGVAGESCLYSTPEKGQYKKDKRAAHLEEHSKDWKSVARFLKQLCSTCKSRKESKEGKESKGGKQRTLHQSVASSAVDQSVGSSSEPQLSPFTRGLLLQAVKSGIPFHAILSDGWREFLEFYTGIRVVNRWTASSHLRLIAEEKLVQMRTKLRSVPHLSLSADIWTSNDRRSFICVFGVWLDEQFEMKSILLDFVEIFGSHTAQAIHSTLKKICADAGIDVAKQVVGLVTDSASNNIAGTKLWREELGLQVDSRSSGNVTLGLAHVPCAAHSLHNSVNDALKLSDLTDVLNKVRTVANAFRNSSLLSGALKRAQGDSSLRLIADVQHRWHSVFLMLSRFLDLRPAMMNAISASQEVISGRKDFETLASLNEADGDVLFEKVKDILKIFRAVHTQAIKLEPHLIPTQQTVAVILATLLRDLKDFMNDEQQQPICQMVSKTIHDGIVTRLANTSGRLRQCRFFSSPDLISPSLRRADC
jgi:hypothetical protein